MSKQNVLKRNFPSATCLKCGEVTDIQFSSCYRQLISKNRTLSEMLKTSNKSLHKWMDIKNGQIQAMHKLIGQIVLKMTEEQRAEAKLLSKEMKDTIKKALKEKFK